MATLRENLAGHEVKPMKAFIGFNCHPEMKSAVEEVARELRVRPSDLLREAIGRTIRELQKEMRTSNT